MKCAKGMGVTNKIEIRRRDGSLIGSYPGASIREALESAVWSHANLSRANLSGAKIDDGSLLVGPRPVVQYGPVGREGRYVVGYVTDKGLRVRAGCFFGDEAAFVAAVREAHGTNEHSREYRAVLDLFRAHAVLFPGEVAA